MTTTQKAFFGLILLLPLVFAGCGTESPDQSTNPEITLSTQVPVFEDHIEALGSGFTPLSTVTSHLMKPDGSEYPELPIMTDANGEFVHDIDTLLMDNGTYEWWVIDDPTDRTSNTATFQVTKE